LKNRFTLGSQGKELVQYNSKRVVLYQLCNIPKRVLDNSVNTVSSVGSYFIPSVVHWKQFTITGRVDCPLKPGFLCSGQAMLELNQVELNQLI